MIPSGEKAKLRRLIEIVGDLPCSEVTRETARNVRDMLARLPANTASLRGQSLNEILKMKHQNTLSAKSLRDHIDLYSRVFKWPRREGLYKGENPFQDIAPRDPVPRNEKRSPITDSELTAIFASPMFTAFDPAKHRPHPY